MKNELYFLIISATLLLSCAEKQETANAETECKSTYLIIPTKRIKLQAV